MTQLQDEYKEYATSIGERIDLRDKKTARIKLGNEFSNGLELLEETEGSHALSSAIKANMLYTAFKTSYLPEDHRPDDFDRATLTNPDLDGLTDPAKAASLITLMRYELGQAGLQNNDDLRLYYYHRAYNHVQTAIDLYGQHDEFHSDLPIAFAQEVGAPNPAQRIMFPFRHAATTCFQYAEQLKEKQPDKTEKLEEQGISIIRRGLNYMRRTGVTNTAFYINLSLLRNELH